jgi:hypothetical protein
MTSVLGCQDYASSGAALVDDRQFGAVFGHISVRKRAETLIDAELISA